MVQWSDVGPQAGSPVRPSETICAHASQLIDYQLYRKFEEVEQGVKRCKEGMEDLRQVRIYRLGFDVRGQFDEVLTSDSAIEYVAASIEAHQRPPG